MYKLWINYRYFTFLIAVCSVANKHQYHYKALISLRSMLMFIPKWTTEYWVCVCVRS